MSPDTLRITPDQDAPPARPGHSAPEPLLLSARPAGALCGRSEASWWRDHSAGRIPAPVKVGGRTLWRLEDLRRWVELGCPSRREYELLRDGAARNGRR